MPVLREYIMEKNTQQMTLSDVLSSLYFSMDFANCAKVGQTLWSQYFDQIR